MKPYVYKTEDFGKTWPVVAPEGTPVRGYAHVVREDTVRKEVLFVGTELGLFVSVDGGKSWAEFKGNDFPSVAVRDLAIQQRDGDLVIATHGRGIWIIDDLTPLRALATQALAQEAAFLPWRATQQRIAGQGGWSEGDATFTGQNPANGAVITYFQRTRHLFGPIKLEILDPAGHVIDDVPASKRRGINRVAWSMQVKPPRVPRAAAIAFAGSQGPRVVPGAYTVRLTKGAHVYQAKLEIGLDRRAPWTVAERRAHFDAAMRVHALFGEMSDLVDRIDAGGRAVAQRLKAQPQDGRLLPLSRKLEAVKKKIVATKEGGAITGEERIREHVDHLYSALLSWEGKPAPYLLERTEALRRELGDVRAEFEGLQPEIKSLGLRLEPTAPVSRLAAACVASRGSQCGPHAGAAAFLR